MALAGVAGFCAIALAGAAWPQASGVERVTVTLRPAPYTITAAHQLKPVFRGDQVTVYQATKAAASGALDAQAAITFKLAPARYLFCVRLPVGVTLRGASESHGRSCEPAEVHRHSDALTLEYGEGARS